MTETRDPTATAAAVRPWGTELCWIAFGVFPLALFSRLFETPALGGASVSWAPPALMAMIATSARSRHLALQLAGLAAIGAALLAGGDSVLTALERLCVYGVEAGVGAALARGWLEKSRGARTPLAFGGLLVIVTVAPQFVGALVAGLVVLPRDLAAGLALFPDRWAAAYSGDSFAALGMFPLALALLREKPPRAEPRELATVGLVSLLVTLVTVLAFLSLPHPFAYCSLVLGTVALVVGPRSRFLMVWLCMASAICVVAHARDTPRHVGIAWTQLNLFLPGIAIGAPIQVLSVALQRIHQAREVLHRSRERFRRLYDQAPVMLQSIDEHGRTLEVNQQWLATLGYDSADAVRGVAFDDFLQPEERDTPGTPWHARLLSGGAHRLHLRMRTRAGRTIHALASATTPDDPGAGRGVVLAFEDVSGELAMRAELERERDSLAALSSATTDIAIFLDAELRYRSVNRAFERFWDVSRSRVIGRHSRDVYGPDAFTEEITPALARALEGEASNFQLLVDAPHGRRAMEVALAPAFDAAGSRAGVVATLHDVTDLLEATRELRSLVDELQHANEGLEQFARIASHDLREPLNTIVQFAALIEQDYGGQLPDEARRWFGLMGKASARMKTMLDDVLQFARLERIQQATLEPVQLERVFAELRELLHARLSQTQARLAVDSPLPAVLGRASLVDLLFQNLLLNAMRYTAPGIEPRIEVSAERVLDLVVVTVADNGVGIPESELERVFAPFHRIKSYRPAEDSGLGLAICRRIATALGGRVWAESDDGRGSRFKVALRAAP